MCGVISFDPDLPGVPLQDQPEPCRVSPMPRWLRNSAGSSSERAIAGRAALEIWRSAIDRLGTQIDIVAADSACRYSRPSRASRSTSSTSRLTSSVTRMPVE